MYPDSTDQVEKLLDNDSAVFHVFVQVEDWNEENKDLLYKILAAIKLDIEKEVRIYGLRQKESAHIGPLLDFKAKHRFLAFGLNADRMGLQMKTIPYQIMTVRDLKILFSHTLTQLQGNVEFKKKLWGLLQQFNFN